MADLLSYVGKSGKGREDGDRVQSIELLYRQHWHDLVAFAARRFGPGPPEPEDVAQAAFARLAAIPMARLEDARAYLFTLAVNAAIDARRQAMRRSVVHRQIEDGELDGSARAPSAERILLGREQLALLERALAVMPKMRRRIFLMVRVEGLSVREVAHRFGIREGSVHKHVSRALQDCAAMLARTEPFGRVR